MKRKFLILVIALICVNCSSDDDQDIKDYTAENQQEILDYIAAQGLDAIASSTGLFYVIDEIGTGDRPTTTSDVTVAYRGYFTNGDVFDESSSEGISFNLSQVIAGWTEGITYFNEGGSGVLLIPSRLAYGNSGIGSIPGGAVLVFDVNLISID